MIDEKHLLAVLNLWKENAESADWRRAIDCVIDHIERGMPKAGWTLCSERLPKEPGEYLVTHIGNKYYGSFVEVLDYDYPRHDSDKMRFHKWDDDMWACYMPSDIIAWQPLPKPYEEE